MATSKTRGRLFLNTIASVLTWGMFLPILLCDICIEIYHRLSFPIYGKPYVKRSNYIRIVDRAKLPYLTWFERIACAYCGYANGWFRYASAIASETEKYWCAIKHIEDRGYRAPESEQAYAPYGDARAYESAVHRN